MVYVLSKTGQPLMPTENHAKVRVLLKQQKAKIVHRCPFTIQLLYDSTDYTQPVSLGIDAGSRHIGVSATTETKVLYEADVTLRNDIGIFYLHAGKHGAPEEAERLATASRGLITGSVKTGGLHHPYSRRWIRTLRLCIRQRRFCQSTASRWKLHHSISRRSRTRIYPVLAISRANSSTSGTYVSMYSSVTAISASAAKANLKIRCLTCIISKAVRPEETHRIT